MKRLLACPIDGERSRGQVLAEFTIAIPLFMLIVLGIAEGGYYVAATTIVNSATHEGARVGVLETTSAPATIQARVREAAAPVVSLGTSSVTLQIAKRNEDGTYQGLGACGRSATASARRTTVLSSAPPTPIPRWWATCSPGLPSRPTRRLS